MLFEDLGFKYLGPVDGHDLAALTETLEKAKNLDEPVLIHVITTKGKGYKPAEQEPNRFHGTGPFDIATGKKIAKAGTPITYTKAFSNTLVESGEKDKKLVAITAAMPEGTGLDVFGKYYPDGSLTWALPSSTPSPWQQAGGQWLPPVTALYSTFARGL
mgnify:CR=1 FL=1